MTNLFGRVTVKLLIAAAFFHPRSLTFHITGAKKRFDDAAPLFAARVDGVISRFPRPTSTRGEVKLGQVYTGPVYLSFVTDLFSRHVSIFES